MKDRTDPTQFQATGDGRLLLAFLQARGQDTAGYPDVVEALAPVLDRIVSGEHPDYARIDRPRLGRHRAQASEVLRWAAASPKADLRSAALATMGELGWEEFLPELNAAAESTEDWERAAAADGLRRMAAAQ
jgi:hypothetical protein